LLETGGVRFPVRGFRGFPLLTAGLSYKSFHFARSASASNTVFRDTGLFRKQLVTITFFYDCEDDLPNTIVIFIYFVVMFLLLCCICNWP
jgi:hypothetical protein